MKFIVLTAIIQLKKTDLTEEMGELCLMMSWVNTDAVYAMTVVLTQMECFLIQKQTTKKKYY